MKNTGDSANRWFGLGAEAFGQLGLKLPEYYVCPLCLHGFPPELSGTLTREHVPPRAVGGSRMVLTCLRCNNIASGKHGIDTHASAAEKLRKISEGTLGRPVRARLNIDSLAVNVNVETVPGKFGITCLPTRNRPNAVDDLKKLLDGYEGVGREGLSFKLFFPGLDCSTSRQKASWLRAGYLAAFASLGYKFIFRSIFDAVRKQIKHPDEAIISFFHFVRPQPPNPAQFLMFVQSPEWARGLLVQMGRHYVMLPISDGDHNFYSRLERGALTSKEARLDGKLLPWPTGPEHRFDLTS